MVISKKGDLSAVFDFSPLLYFNCPEVVLLTGGTGYVGSFVAQHLGIDTAVSTVYCLVRASDAGAAKQRLLSTFTKRGIAK